MNKYNIIQSKSLAFALKIVDLCKNLMRNNEYILSRQLLKSGTSIGANVEEAIGGISRKDVISKFSIAYKEARESKYWLVLLANGKFIDENSFRQLSDDCEELLKIISKIITNNKKLLT